VLGGVIPAQGVWVAHWGYRECLGRIRLIRGGLVGGGSRCMVCIARSICRGVGGSGWIGMWSVICRWSRRGGLGWIGGGRALAQRLGVCGGQ